MQKAKMIMVRFSALTSAGNKGEAGIVKLSGNGTEKSTEEFYIPNRFAFVFSSCCSKAAAVPFRWGLAAVGAPSCEDPLMLLPLASETWTTGCALKLSSLV